MTIRTFRQHAQAYGSTPCSVVVEFDGTTVFSGPVSTIDEEPLLDPDLLGNSVQPYNTNVAYTWEDDVAYAGTKNVSITVSGSDLLLGSSVANYRSLAGRDTSFDGFYSVDDPSGGAFSDPFSNVSIDGNAQTLERNGMNGQWTWTIPAGSTFTATMTVQAGVEPPTP